MCTSIIRHNDVLPLAIRPFSEFRVIPEKSNVYIGAEVNAKVSVGILARYVYSELDGKQMFDFGHQIDLALGQHVKSDRQRLRANANGMVTVRFVLVAKTV